MKVGDFVNYIPDENEEEPLLLGLVVEVQDMELEEGSVMTLFTDDGSNWDLESNQISDLVLCADPDPEVAKLLTDSAPDYR